MDSIGTELAAGVCACVCACACVCGVCVCVCVASSESAVDAEDTIYYRTQTHVFKGWVSLTFLLGVQETLQLPVKVEQRAVELKRPTDDAKSMS
jgi:hypothetical protein